MIHLLTMDFCCRWFGRTRIPYSQDYCRVYAVTTLQPRSTLRLSLSLSLAHSLSLLQQWAIPHETNFTSVEFLCICHSVCVSIYARICIDNEEAVRCGDSMNEIFTLTPHHWPKVRRILRFSARRAKAG